MSITNSRIGSRVSIRNADLINIYDSSIGDGTRIGAFTEIGGADVGTACIIGSFVKISRECKLGDSVCVGNNTVILSGTSIGNNVNIGPCTIIAPDITIGDEARIEDMAVVGRNVLPGERISRHTSSKSAHSKGCQCSNDPAVSSDHPAHIYTSKHQRPYQRDKAPKISEEYIQLNLNELLGIGEFEDSPRLSKTRACKGPCMEEPKSEEDDLLGLKLRSREE